MVLKIKAFSWASFRKYSFLKLWLVHGIVLYSFLGMLMGIGIAVFPHNPNLTFGFIEILSQAFFGTVAGILGWLDGFPAFMLFPVVLMGMIRLYWHKSNWFTSYLLALLICYTIKGILDTRWYLIGIALGDRQLKDLLPMVGEYELLGLNLLGTFLILLTPIGVIWWLFRGSRNKDNPTDQELNL